MKSTPKSPASRGRVPVWLAGAVVLISVAVVPTGGTAQVSTCWECIESGFEPTDPLSTMCSGALFGRTNCINPGTPEFHLCLDYGPLCWPGKSGAEDELAVASARAGLTPSIDSNYLVLAEAGDVVVLRRCGAEVARFAMSERGVESPAGLVAMHQVDRLEHPRVPYQVAATDPRQRTSEQ